MKKNKVIQFSLAILAIILFFKTYYSNDKDKIVDVDKNVLNEDVNMSTEDTVNIIQNAKYSGESSGIFFELNAGIAEIKSDNQNISYLQDVTAVIKLRDLRTIHIRSDKAVFNKKNNDAKFLDNILYEIKGDAEYHLGLLTDARLSYLKAIESTQSPSVQAILKMKLADLEAEN